MRLIILGDLHFYRLWLWPWHMVSKRLLGQSNLWFNRRRHFRASLWPMIQERAESLNPDAVLAVGDLTTTALHSEFRMALTCLTPLLKGKGSFVIPGNHDRYTFSSYRRRRFEKHFGLWTSDVWPAVRVLSPGLHLIALDPTRANPVNASGRVGEGQRARLKSALAEIPHGDRIIVLCHYPLGDSLDFPPESPGHGLRDQSEMKHLLAATGRSILYLHGHVHQPWCFRPEEAPRVTVLNAGAPLLVSKNFPKGQGFVEIESDAEGLSAWRHLSDAEGKWSRVAITPKNESNLMVASEGIHSSK